MEVLKPIVVQISGGEPLMRSDLEEVVLNIKSSSGLPYIILVSNWSEMTLERYQKLRKAGVDEFCVSLDFPDERHDDFRGLPGHFHHLSQIIPQAAALGYDDIVMNNCITAWNLAEINATASKAKEWGANINFSAYSPRRTGCRDYFPTTPEQLAVLDRELDILKERINKSHWITNNATTLDATRDYFHRGGTPNCKAGLRWRSLATERCSPVRCSLSVMDCMNRREWSKNSPHPIPATNAMFLYVLIWTNHMLSC